MVDPSAQYRHQARKVFDRIGPFIIYLFEEIWKIHQACKG
ncbi:hypothetical protein NC99_42310 [Sunxiuqinia dokdonensis]|uniref:Uncharacterized protein n=1 Tax=Sunxiuqinia dokdonensis TaxID=1409788 RepID=A0A0L8V3D7_9BACT|nr:hypothetical protein NC99_42310 [Sunxiuqinia dokdonensis]